MIFIPIQSTQLLRLFVHLVLLIPLIRSSDTPSIQLRVIPDECSNPPFGSCTFYADCLESRYHCGPSGYPIAYGQYYCEAFSAARSMFSTQGQEWLTNTMQCLQAALVPEATGVDNPTCSALADEAFGTHATCYVENGFCSLSVEDWAKTVSVVGWTTLMGNWHAIKSTIQVAVDCANISWHGWFSVP